MELRVWTAPVWFENLDYDFSNAPEEHLCLLSTLPNQSLQMTGTAAKVFGGKIADEQPMGPLLFWQVINTGASQATLAGDIYLAVNHIGVLSMPSIGRVVGGPAIGINPIAGGQALSLRGMD